MQVHGLKQAIACVNRMFRYKPARLIAACIGIAQHLRSAPQQFSMNDQENTDVNEAPTITVMMEKHEVARNYAPRPQLRLSKERLPTGAPSDDGMCRRVDPRPETEACGKEKTKEGKKNAHRRYWDAAPALPKTFAPASARDETRETREEVSFFRAIRSAPVKSLRAAE